MKYLYIGKKRDENKFIYCDEAKLRFYAMDEELINEDDGLEYLYDLMDEDYEDEEMKPYRITDPNFLKALTVAYKTKKAFDLKTKHLEIQKRLGEKERVKKIREFQRDVAHFFLCALLLASSIVRSQADSYCINKTEETIEASLDEDRQFSVYDEFGWALTDNKTLSNELLEVLFGDFRMLSFSDIPITDEEKDKIIKRIEKYDFSNLDRSNYLDALEYLIFGKKSVINTCFASSLDRYANGDLDPSISIMFGELTIPLNDNYFDVIFFNGDYTFKEKLANIYNVDVSEIDYTLYILENYMNSTDEVEKNNLYTIYQNKVAGLLSSFYKEKEEITEFDKYVLGSQIFNGDYLIDNNGFEQYIKISHSSDDYKLYTKYYSPLLKTDQSEFVYLNKLTELIEEKGTNLDYNDPDCRFLLYLYTLCYRDELHYNNDYLVSIKTAEELAYKIFYEITDEDGYTTIEKEFIYNYFTSGQINPDDMRRAINSVYDEALSVSLFVDVVNCLKMEKYIPSGTFDGKVEETLRYLERDDPNLYTEVKKALDSGESLFDKISLLPSFQAYKSDTVKKYILESEEKSY